MALNFQTALPENRRYFIEQFTIDEPNKSITKRLASFDSPVLIESIQIQAFDAYMIPDPVIPSKLIPERARAIVREREDRDPILVFMKRLNNQEIAVTSGATTQAIDLFAFNELFKIGNNGGFYFPQSTELQFTVQHQVLGNKPSCGIPITGNIIVSLFYENE